VSVAIAGGETARTARRHRRTPHQIDAVGAGPVGRARRPAAVLSRRGGGLARLGTRPSPWCGSTPATPSRRTAQRTPAPSSSLPGRWRLSRRGLGRTGPCRRRRGPRDGRGGWGPARPSSARVVLLGALSSVSFEARAKAVTRRPDRGSRWETLRRAVGALDRDARLVEVDDCAA